MAMHKFTDNGSWNSTIAGRINGICMLKYVGDLGGGTLALSSLSTTIDPETGEALETPVADGKLTASKVDGNGDVVQQVIFQTLGTIFVTLSGATDPDVKVMVE